MSRAVQCGRCGYVSEYGACDCLYADKPRDYHDRRKWQDAQRAAGLPVECGREACRTRTSAPWTNTGTPLLYCPRCGRMINQYNPGLCAPEGGGAR